MPRVKVNSRYFDMTTVRVTGFPLIDENLWATHIRSVKFGRKITPGVVRGTSGLPIARTPGTQDCNCSMQVVYEAWSKFMKILKQGGINGISAYDFDVTINFTLAGNSSEVKWINASLLSDDISAQQGGTDGVPVDLDMWAEDITIDGVSLYPPEGDNPSPPIALV